MSDRSQPLREGEVQADPISQFRTWFAAAQESPIALPEAAALATATPAGAPSVRMVLIKHVDERGFVFYSNYGSRKAAELAANPRAALAFHWSELARQVRVEGVVRRTAPEESAAYIQTRPRASRLSALASPQSHPIESREWLERRVAELAGEYADTELPVPEGWGGFRLVPDLIELWQGRDDRLHDRLLYTRAAGAQAWRLERLAP